MSFSPNKEQLELLWHTLGIRPEQRQPNRNFFHAGPGHYANTDLELLREAGFMAIGQTPDFVEKDAVIYFVTEKGKELAVQTLPEPPKPSRYEEFLRNDGYFSFADYLGIDLPQLEHQFTGDRLMRFTRVSHKRGYRHVISGEWCKTQKQAKASYKEALKNDTLEYKALIASEKQHLDAMALLINR